MTEAFRGKAEAVRHGAAFLAVVWIAAALVIEVGSYLSLDAEWSLLPTAALFGSSFLIGAIGAFFVARRHQFPVGHTYAE